MVNVPSSMQAQRIIGRAPHLFATSPTDLGGGRHRIAVSATYTPPDGPSRQFKFQMS